MTSLVTRGLGGDATQILVQGFSSTPTTIVETIERPLRLRQAGQSGTKRRLHRQLEPVVVWAKLVEANGRVPATRIVGAMKSDQRHSESVSTVMVEHVTTRRREAWEHIKVSVQRLIG